MTKWPWVNENIRKEAERIIEMGSSGADEAERFFMNAFEACDTDRMRCALDVAEATGALPAVLEQLKNVSASNDERKSFLSFWVVSGWIMREKVKDDCSLCDVLRNLLPPYEGSEMTLYRGEIATQYDNEVIGFAWTTKYEKARGYARGLHSLQPGGGILLESLVPAEAIISDLRELSHIRKEFEIVVDPQGLNQVRPMERFTPHSKH